VSIVIKNFQKKIQINSEIKRKIKSCVLKTFSLEGIRNTDFEITICLLNNRQIREFNLMYLAKDSPTDVIAFNLGPYKSKTKNILADILVSTDAAFSNAKIFNTTPLYELCLYVAHGMLHILGYDDKTIQQGKVMEERSRCILRDLLK